jgi:hypothetical protein
MEAMPHNDVSRGLKMAVDETGLQFLFSTMAGYGDMQAKGDQMSRYDG